MKILPRFISHLIALVIGAALVGLIAGDQISALKRDLVKSGLMYIDAKAKLTLCKQQTGWKE